MTTICNICGEEVSDLRTFSFIILGLAGGCMVVGFWSNNPIYQLLGALVGLVFVGWMLYSYNPLHFKHTILGKLHRTKKS